MDGHYLARPTSALGKSNQESASYLPINTPHAMRSLWHKFSPDMLRGRTNTRLLYGCFPIMVSGPKQIVSAWYRSGVLIFMRGDLRDRNGIKAYFAEPHAVVSGLVVGIPALAFPSSVCGSARLLSCAGLGLASPSLSAFSAKKFCRAFFHSSIYY